MRSLHRVLLLLFTALLGLTARAPQLAHADGFGAGAARVDLTPSDEEIAAGRIWLGGYGACGFSTRRATGVHDRMAARALVISDGATKLALVMVDAIGVSNRRINTIRDLASAATGISPQNILVGATHTHSAPDMQGLWCGVSSTYKAYFDAQVARAVIQADANLQPATLRTNTIQLNGLQSNRRGWGFSDTDLSVLQAVDVGGVPIATLVEFAAHATFLGYDNTLIARDWPGATQDQIEARGGGIAIVNAGDQGDIVPAWPAGGFAGADEYGATIAQTAYDTLASAVDVTTPQVYRATARNIAVTNGLFLLAYHLGWLDYDLVYPCAEGGFYPCVRTDIAYIRYGPQGFCQLQVAVAPGEALTRTGLKIKAAFTTRERLFLGLTHNSLGYAVASDEWNKAPNGSRYEETVSPTPSFGDTVISTVTSLASADFCY